MMHDIQYATHCFKLFYGNITIPGADSIMTTLYVLFIYCNTFDALTAEKSLLGIEESILVFCMPFKNHEQ